MAETERRRGYWHNQVLIDSDRILTPQFGDAVVWLSGAQLEMLRNVSQYLNRISTYCAETHEGYYLVPTDADYDDILAIVADLEETLMGNANVIFGYKDVRYDVSEGTVSGAGDKTRYVDAPAAGEVFRIEGAGARNEDTACTKIRIEAGFIGGYITVAEKLNPAINEEVVFTGILTLKEDGAMRATFYGCEDGDFIRFTARGYTMDVPE